MIFLCFLYLFNFNIIKGYSFTESAFLVAGLLFVYCMIKPQYNKHVSIFLGSRFNRWLLCVMLLLIGAAFIIPLAQMTFDFSYAVILIHQLIDLEIGILLVALFKYKNKKIICTVLDCFFIQSIIQMVCFLSPTVTKITDIFRSDSLIAKRTANYLGYRGLAISGSNFFGLAVAYAIVFIVLAFYWDEWNKSLPGKLIYVACMTFGAMSAGRTAILGIALFAAVRVIITLKRIRNQKVIRNMIMTFCMIAMGVLIFKNTLASYFAQNASWQRFSYYLFQFMGEDGSGASVSNITSLTHMFQDMYFLLTPKQFLIGDGMYTLKDGSYYMHTDVGYMRNLLFWGVFMTIALYAFQYKQIMRFVKNNRQKLVAWSLFLASAVFELKGQTMGFLIISQCLLLLIVFDLEMFTENKKMSNVPGDI